jgi:hypothetical protein
MGVLFQKGIERRGRGSKKGIMARVSPAPVGFVAPTNLADVFDYSEHSGLRQLTEDQLVDLLMGFDYTEQESRSLIWDLVDTGVARRVVPNVNEVDQMETDPSSAAMVPMFILF